jgi:hypothetical protein
MKTVIILTLFGLSLTAAFAEQTTLAIGFALSATLFSAGRSK